jgi:hypothetical protein
MDILKSIALIKLAYEMENVTRERFCMGVFYDSDKWVFSSRCLNIYPEQKLIGAYTGFDDWNFNLTGDATNWIEATSMSTEFEIDTNLKSGLSSMWWYIYVSGVIFLD